MENLTLLQFKIGPELLQSLKKRLEKLQTIHEDEVDSLIDEIKASPTEKQAEKLQIRWEALHERGRRITLHNVARAAITEGLSDPDHKRTLNRIAKEGTPLGRPSRLAG